MERVTPQTTAGWPANHRHRKPGTRGRRTCNRDRRSRQTRAFALADFQGHRYWL